MNMLGKTQLRFSEKNEAILRQKWLRFPSIWVRFGRFRSWGRTRRAESAGDSGRYTGQCRGRVKVACAGYERTLD
jgi:hypothetical protein